MCLQKSLNMVTYIFKQHHRLYHNKFSLPKMANKLLKSGFHRSVQAHIRFLFMYIYECSIGVIVNMDKLMNISMSFTKTLFVQLQRNAKCTLYIFSCEIQIYSELNAYCILYILIERIQNDSSPIKWHNLSKSFIQRRFVNK